MRLLFFVSETQCKKTDFTIELQKENPYNILNTIINNGSVFS